MNYYYKIILKIAFIFLIVVISYLYYIYPIYPTIYPPNKSDCPDYWDSIKVKGNNVCLVPSESTHKNIGNLFESNKQNFDWKYYITENKLDIMNDSNTAWNHYNNNNATNLKFRFNGSYRTPGYNNELGPEDTYVNFNDEYWNNSIESKDCKYKLWSNKNNIEWEGISNYNRC
tara:strand:+ start:3407 stop:3925 length:519 start_codon:yes stop_codon:yes gene_type:complete